MEGVEKYKIKDQCLCSTFKWKQSEDQDFKEFFKAYKEQSSALHIFALKDLHGQIYYSHVTFIYVHRFLWKIIHTLVILVVNC